MYIYIYITWDWLDYNILGWLDGSILLPLPSPHFGDKKVPSCQEDLPDLLPSVEVQLHPRSRAPGMDKRWSFVGSSEIHMGVSTSS